MVISPRKGGCCDSQVTVRTTSAKKHDPKAITGLFSPVPGLEETLRVLASFGYLTARQIEAKAGCKVSNPIIRLMHRGLLVRSGHKVGLNDRLPFMSALRIFLATLHGGQPYLATAAVPFAEPASFVVADVFRRPTTIRVLIALLAGPLTGPDLRRGSERLLEEASRLTKVGILRRSIANHITIYAFDDRFPGMSELRTLLEVLRPFVEDAAIPTSHPMAPTNFGALHPNARLSDADINSIVRRRRKGENAQTIAIAFGVTPTYVAALAKSKYRRSVG